MLREFLYNWLTKRKKKESFLFRYGTLDITVTYKVADEEAVQKSWKDLEKLLENNDYAKLCIRYFP